MGGGDKVFETGGDQGVVEGGLLVKDVDRRAAERAGGESGEQSGLIH